MRHSTASSPNFCATFAVPRDNSRAEWLTAGSALRRPSTTVHRRSSTVADRLGAGGVSVWGRSGSTLMRSLDFARFAGLAVFICLVVLAGFARTAFLGFLRIGFSTDFPMVASLGG